MSICDGDGGILKVEYSDDPSLAWNDGGHTWNDISGVTGVLDVTGGDKQAQEFRTHSGSLTGLSSSGLINVVLTAVFQNSTTSFLEFLTDSWDGTSSTFCFYIRWSYNAGASGALRRTAKVALLSNPFTGGDPGSGSPVTKQLTMVVDGVINRDTVA